MTIHTDIDNIAKGITNSFLNRKEYISKKRMEICMQCPHSYNKHEVVFGPKCQLCGCVLKWKTRSDSNCPEGRWEEYGTTEESSDI